MATDAPRGEIRHRETKPRRYVAYYRVSTKQQGRSGLGLEPQRASVQNFVKSVSGTLFAEYTEVESGTKAHRPQFVEALRICRVYSATIVIARLDRLARNVALISKLMESDVEFVAADFPQANRLTIHILAAIAEYEARLISERVKAGFLRRKRVASFGVATETRQRLTWTRRDAWETMDVGVVQSPARSTLNHC